MDPATAVIILAMHLCGCGALLWGVSRQMPPGSGIRLWAAGSMLFGLAYVGRLASGLHAAGLPILLIDALMVLATILFSAGMRQFIGLPGWPSWLPPLVLGAYGIVGAAAVVAYGLIGRHTVLNVTLGAFYGYLAWLCARVRGGQPPPLRAPLLALAGVVGLLAVLTVARALHVASAGREVLYAGPYAQVYYGYASFAAVMVALMLLWMVFVRLNLQLAELASRDALTRVLNRNGLDEALSRHFGDRAAAPVTLMQLDLDHFKRVNDEHGHATGDALLRAVGEVLRTHVRPNDFVARTGGEEFLVGCVTGDAAHAAAFAERLRAALGAVEVTSCSDGRTTIRCTASVGLSRPFRAKADWESAAREADAALYAAKSAGRDRVALAPFGAAAAAAR